MVHHAVVAIAVIVVAVVMMLIQFVGGMVSLDGVVHCFSVFYLWMLMGIEMRFQKLRNRCQLGSLARSCKLTDTPTAMPPYFSDPSPVRCGSPDPNASEKPPKPCLETVGLEKVVCIQTQDSITNAPQEYGQQRVKRFVSRQPDKILDGARRNQWHDQSQNDIGAAPKHCKMTAIL